MQPDCVMCEGTSECWIHSDFYRRIKANKSKLTDEQRTKFHNQVNELIDICGEVVVAGKKDLESYLSDEYVSKSEVDRLIREARIDELRSIDYGCDEDVEENDVILKKILDEAKSTIDGRSLRNRVEWLSKQKDSNKSG